MDGHPRIDRAAALEAQVAARAGSRLCAGLTAGGASDVPLGGSRGAGFREGGENAAGGGGRPTIQVPAAAERVADITETRKRRGADETASPVDTGETANEAWRQLIDA